MFKGDECELRSAKLNGGNSIVWAKSVTGALGMFDLLGSQS